MKKSYKLQVASCKLLKPETCNLKPATSRKGQATTEMVILVPVFLLFAIGIMKIFALSILVQKMELACYYAGRRWMLESHKNAMHTGWDQGELRRDIEKRLAAYLGAGDDFKEKFLGFKREDIRLRIDQTILYAVLTLHVRTKGLIPFQPEMEKEWQIVKYVPTRDRPIKWNIPSVAEDEGPPPTVAEAVGEQPGP